MAPSTPQPHTVILVTRDGMGEADQSLRHTLVAKYFQLLLADGKLPGAVCFYADGVKLTCAGSPVIETLRAFEAQGVPLIVCSTCLAYFGLKDSLQVGLAGSMPDIIEAQWQASKVITI